VLAATAHPRWLDSKRQERQGFLWDMWTSRRGKSRSRFGSQRSGSCGTGKPQTPLGKLKYLKKMINDIQPRIEGPARITRKEKGFEHVVYRVTRLYVRYLPLRYAGWLDGMVKFHRIVRLARHLVDLLDRVSIINLLSRCRPKEEFWRGERSETTRVGC